MTYPLEKLQRIFEKTGGYCHHCGTKLAWKNYGDLYKRASWEVDHSVPKSGGGTDHLNNLVPSCIPCNRAKGDLTSKQYATLLEADSNETKDNSLSLLLLLGGIVLLYGYSRARSGRYR